MILKNIEINAKRVFRLICWLSILGLCCYVAWGEWSDTMVAAFILAFATYLWKEVNV